MRIGPGPQDWERVKLFTDKTASERRLRELQTLADQRQAGMHTPETDALKRPITELRDMYVADLKRQRSRKDHVRISEWMLNRLIELGKWRRFSDVTVESIHAILEKLEADGATVGYRNTFIKRAKAFVHFFLPDNWPDPLRKLKRIRLCLKTVV